MLSPTFEKGQAEFGPSAKRHKAEVLVLSRANHGAGEGTWESQSSIRLVIVQPGTQGGRSERSAHLKPRQIWAIRFFLDQHSRMRDHALFDLAIDSKLRGCDVVKVRISDLVLGGQVRTRAIVVQSKTGRPVQFELMQDARASLLAWLERRGGALADYVFPSRIDHADHLSTRQYARLVDEWVVGVGLRREEYDTHSLRRTKASTIYKATGNLRAVQLLLGHTKIENTVRYLRVDVEDALTLA